MSSDDVRKRFAVRNVMSASVINITSDAEVEVKPATLIAAVVKADLTLPTEEYVSRHQLRTVFDRLMIDVTTAQPADPLPFIRHRLMQYIAA